MLPLGDLPGPLEELCRLKGHNEREESCGSNCPGPVSHPHPAWLSLITLEGAILVLLGAMQGQWVPSCNLEKNRGVIYIKKKASLLYIKQKKG